MKAEVLRCRFDGNTIVTPYMELKVYVENIYLSLSDKNGYGNKNYDYFHVVCKVENIYFSCGQCSGEILGREEQKGKLVRYCRNWITNMLRDAENGNHVSLLSIHAFEGPGLDTAPLLQAHEACRERQEQKR